MRERQKEQTRRILQEIRHRVGSANPSPRSGDETSSQLSSPPPSLKIMNDDEVLKKEAKKKKRKERIRRILLLRQRRKKRRKQIRAVIVNLQVSVTLLFSSATPFRGFTVIENRVRSCQFPSSFSSSLLQSQGQSFDITGMARPLRITHIEVMDSSFQHKGLHS